MTNNWRKTPLVRVLGSAASWFLFALCFTLLYSVSQVVMGLGGSCASGGPYEIAVECPDSVVAFAPLSIWGGLLAVGISLYFAQGFGTPLTTWGWPILFVGLGIAFLMAGGAVGWGIGIMFVIMGLVPLVLELRASPQRVFLGSRNAAGAQFREGDKARRSLLSMGLPNTEDAVSPSGIDWLLSLMVLAVAAGGGYLVGVAWFAAASSAG